jgi:hypothetical protein
LVNKVEFIGARKYITSGLGFKYYKFNFDLAYLIPTESKNPMRNTIRFSLGYNF